MPITRRDFVKTGATAAAAMVMPRPLLAHFGKAPEAVPPMEDPRVKELALKALDAARAAGAAYADVRLTHDWYRGVDPSRVTDSEFMAVGVRALVNGYWGFASSPVWSAAEMARLGAEAVHQALVNASGQRRVVELAPAPAIPDGHWVMPVKHDPFAIHPYEIRDELRSLGIFAALTPGVKPEVGCALFKQEKAFASTLGSYCTQRTYRTEGTVRIELSKEGRSLKAELGSLSAAGMGWELFRDQPVREQIQRTIQDLEEELKLPIKPVEVGRYDTVFDAVGVATLLDETLGRATELDRALGYEANAGGTSYLNRPFEMLGSYQVAAPALTLTANRAERGGCATVQWDDEGITPDEFTLVQEGVLTDFQTTRESAGWLKDHYAKAGRPFRSHGCANADGALNAPLQHSPNLALAPARESHTFDDLVAGLNDGIAVKGALLDMDFQHLNGLVERGRFYAVKRGKRVAVLNGAGILFRAPELWKGLFGLGGRESAHRFGMAASKGEPAQATYHSVTAVPAAFRQLTLVDVLRKA